MKQYWSMLSELEDSAIYEHKTSPAFKVFRKELYSQLRMYLENQLWAVIYYDELP